MPNLENTIYDIDDWFLANPKEVSLLAGLIIEIYNLIDQSLDEINRRTLVA